MKRSIPLIAIYTLLVLIASSQSRAVAQEKAATSEDLLAVVTKLASLTLVTPEPLPMNYKVHMLCRKTMLAEKDHAELVQTPSAHYKVYVTSGGADAMKDLKATFPTGSVILKQKLRGKDDTTPLLYTGMIKREKGFNPDCGDWEFFLVDGDGTKITERGKLKSCMDCHTLYPNSDFVTKKYVK